MSTEAIRDVLRDGSFAQGHQGRDRTIAIARREVEAPGSRHQPSGSGLRRALIALVSAGLLIVLAFTPPGEAASGWLGRLVGIGDVGGPPTIQPRSGGNPLHPPLVIANGHTPDGNRYEVVEYTTDTHDVCFALSFPNTNTRLAGGECYNGEAATGGLTNGFGVTLPNAHETPRTVWAQGVVSRDTTRVRVRYTTSDGRTGAASVRVAFATPDIRRRIGTDQRAGLFVVFVPPSADPRNGGRVKLSAYARNGSRIGEPIVLLPAPNGGVQVQGK